MITKTIETHVYNIIYAENIKGQLMQAMTKKRKRSVADVYALKKRMQVEITFPISPFMSHDQLYIHYQRGVCLLYTSDAADE